MIPQTYPISVKFAGIPDADQMGLVNDFQTVPGCGLRCTVTSLSPPLRGSPAYDFKPEATSAQLCSVPIETCYDGSSGDDQRLLQYEQLLAIDNEQPRNSSGKCKVVIGNREWMVRNGLNVNEHVDRLMSEEEEMGMY